MVDSMTAFGGHWTEKKLDCVSSYLEAYQTALKNKNFDLVYIDAFSGDGAVELKDDDSPLLKEGRLFTRGSARRAIDLDQPFHQYHFIDRSQASLDELRRIVSQTNPALLDHINLHAGDVNKVLPRIVQGLDVKRNRAVVFADPFGMQLDWETVKAVAAVPIIDFWYLVPTGLAINRLATKDGKMPRGWSNRLNRFLGETDWRKRWYKPSLQEDLFGASDVMEKTVGLDEIEADFHRRLGNAFALVAPNRLRLKDKGRVLFTLMFGCSNPSPKAHGLAVRIANHLLKG